MDIFWLNENSLSWSWMNICVEKKIVWVEVEWIFVLKKNSLPWMKILCSWILLQTANHKEIGLPWPDSCWIPDGRRRSTMKEKPLDRFSQKDGNANFPRMLTKSRGFLGHWRSLLIGCLEQHAFNTTWIVLVQFSEKSNSWKLRQKNPPFSNLLRKTRNILWFSWVQ